MPFEQFPWFRSATIEQLSVFEWPSADHLYWPISTSIYPSLLFVIPRPSLSYQRHAVNSSSEPTLFERGSTLR